MNISDVQLSICVQIMVEFLMQIDHRSSKSNFRTRLLRRDSWYSKSVLGYTWAKLGEPGILRLHGAMDRPASDWPLDSDLAGRFFSCLSHPLKDGR